MGMQITSEELDKRIGAVLETKLAGITSSTVEAVNAAVKANFAETKAGWNPNPKAELTEEQIAAQNKEVEAQRGKFKGFGEFLSSVFRARNLGVGDNRLRYMDEKGNVIGDIDPAALKNLNKPVDPNSAKAALAGSGDSTGGFLIPVEFQADLLALEQEESVVRSNGAWVIPMKSDTLLIPRVDETSRASHLFGGAVARWTAEAAAMTESEPKFAQTRLQAKELTGYTVASNTLLQDNAVGLEAFLKRILSEVPAWFEDLAFLVGSGDGMPLGIQAAGSCQSLTRKSTNNLYRGDIATLYSRIFPKSAKKAIWLANQTCLDPLMGAGTADAANTNGANLVWFNQYQGGMTQAPPMMIMGRPLILTEKIPAYKSAGDIMFADLSYYIIGDRAALTIDASSHVGFTTNQTYWRFVKRVDGQPWLQSKLTPRNGDALSPFVMLGATS